MKLKKMKLNDEQESQNNQVQPGLSYLRASQPLSAHFQVHGVGFRDFVRARGDSCKRIPTLCVDFCFAFGMLVVLGSCLTS